MSNKYSKKKIKKEEVIVRIIIIVILMILTYLGDIIYYKENKIENVNTNVVFSNYNLANIPEYNDKIYIEINNNIPYFDENEITIESFEKYSELDDKERCGVAYANICKEIMPKDGQMRESISRIKPSGWQQTMIDGEYLYNRCHLIAYQLADESANEKKYK